MHRSHKWLTCVFIKLTTHILLGVPWPGSLRFPQAMAIHCNLSMDWFKGNSTGNHGFSWFFTIKYRAFLRFAVIFWHFYGCCWHFPNVSLGKLEIDLDKLEHPLLCFKRQGPWVDPTGCGYLLADECLWGTSADLRRWARFFDLNGWQEWRILRANLWDF